MDLNAATTRTATKAKRVLQQWNKIVNHLKLTISSKKAKMLTVNWSHHPIETHWTSITRLLSTDHMERDQE